MKHLIALTLLTSCGSPVKPPSATPDVRISDAIVTLRSMTPMDSTIGFYSEYANTNYVRPQTNSSLDDGDSTLRNGQLCFSGESQYCPFVKSAIDSNGRIWRSPARVENSWEVETSSRDQLLGVLLYLSRTHDKTTADKIISYIESNDGRLCLDGRCSVSNMAWIGPMYGLMRVVWNHIGLTPTSKMYISNTGDETTLLASAQSVDIGYQLHLIANQILVYQHCSVFTTKLRSTANVVYSRDPGNPFYGWIAGKNVTEQFITMYPKSYGRRVSWGLQDLIARYTETKDNIGSWLMLANIIQNGVK